MATTLAAGLGGQWLTARSTARRERVGRLETARSEPYLTYLNALTELAVGGSDSRELALKLNSATNQIKLVAGSASMVNLVAHVEDRVTSNPGDVDLLMVTIEQFALRAREDLGVEPIFTQHDLIAMRGELTDLPLPPLWSPVARGRAWRARRPAAVSQCHAAKVLAIVSRSTAPAATAMTKS